MLQIVLALKQLKMHIIKLSHVIGRLGDMTSDSVDEQKLIQNN